MRDPEIFTPEIIQALGAEFGTDEVEFLPRAASGGMALGLPYIDARDVMRRLDATVGPHNWQFDFDVLSPDGKMVRGKLTVLGNTKCDAGEAAQEDEPLKSAVSDALKRCAVHFGVGRYLYYLPRIWAPFDPQKRRFIETPRIDPAAIRRALKLCGIAASSSQARKENPERTAQNTPPESAGDRAAQREATAQRETATPATPAPSGAAPDPLLCTGEGCQRPITRGQSDISVRSYGKPLCPACQKAASQPEGTAPVPAPTTPAAAATEEKPKAAGRTSPWAAGVQKETAPAATPADAPTAPPPAGATDAEGTPQEVVARLAEIHGEANKAKVGLQFREQMAKKAGIKKFEPPKMPASIGGVSIVQLAETLLRELTAPATVK